MDHPPAKETVLAEPHAPVAEEPILVALGADARALRLVHTGFRMAREQGRPWLAAHVEVPDWETDAEAEQARVWLKEARDLGAETVWVRAATVADGLVRAGAERRINQVVLGGEPPAGAWARLGQARVLDTLRRGLGAQVVQVPLGLAAPGPRAAATAGDRIGAVLACAVLMGVCAIFATALFTVVGFPGIPPVLVLGVGFIAHRWGPAYSVPASLLSIPLFDALYSRSPFPYQAADWTNALYLGGTLILAQLVVVLVDRLHRETRALRRREAEALLVLVLGRALAGCTTVGEMAQVLTERLQGLFKAQAWVLVPGAGDTWVQLPAAPAAPASPRPSEFLPHFNDPTTRTGPFEPLHLDSCTYAALAGQGGAEGLLQLRLADGRALDPGSWSLFQSLAVQGALALERIRWLEEASRARLATESERLRTTLLGAVSHDLRTPLAAIQGAASSLLLPEPLPEATRQDMLAMIRDESERLARLLGDLLELTRLQSGAIRAHKEWQLLDEVVGAAVLRQEAGRGRLEIHVDLPESLPPVPLDGALMEQVLLNLLGNAQRHAPGSPVRLRAWASPGAVQLEVADRGPGIPPAYRQQVFDKFFRMPGNLRDGGAGLGLAICGAIVGIHGGSIWVEDNPGGGARFRISLPLDGPPPVPPEAEGPAPLPGTAP
jgi:two-component system sensor histidine kinase KdpD